MVPISPRSAGPVRAAFGPLAQIACALPRISGDKAVSACCCVKPHCSSSFIPQSDKPTARLLTTHAARWYRALSSARMVAVCAPQCRISASISEAQLPSSVKNAPSSCSQEENLSLTASSGCTELTRAPCSSAFAKIELGSAPLQWQIHLLLIGSAVMSFHIRAITPSGVVINRVSLASTTSFHEVKHNVLVKAAASSACSRVRL